jgi:hypothetical protein
VEQNCILNKFETFIEFNATMNELGNFLAQGANGPQNRAAGEDVPGATAGNINSDNLQHQGVNRKVVLAQMIYQMKI